MVIMSSPMVSNMMEFRENFHNHNDFTASNAYIIGRKLEQLLAQAQETSMLERPDLPASNYLSPVNMNSRPPISRRHSSSYNNPTISQAKLATLVETKNLFNAVLAAGLETLAEERIRNRAFSEGAFIDPKMDQQHQPPQSTTSRYKTELCRPFEENGKCKYGEKCQFAHGKHELRQMIRHPKYKTELCRTYHTTGLCPYGPRCHFIHNQDEVALDQCRQAIGNSSGPNPKGPNVPFSQRQHLKHFPGIRIPNVPYPSPQITSPLDVPSPFFGPNETGPMSPISPPIGKSNGPRFTYPTTIFNEQVIGNDNRRSPPLHITFDRLSNSEDSLFDGSSSDSERESSTGSPPGLGAVPLATANTQQPQRLPIFRCLSQSA